MPNGIKYSYEDLRFKIYWFSHYMLYNISWIWFKETIFQHAKDIKIFRLKVFKVLRKVIRIIAHYLFSFIHFRIYTVQTYVRRSTVEISYPTI